MCPSAVSSTAKQGSLPASVTYEQACMLLGHSRDVIDRWTGGGILRTVFRGRAIELLTQSIVERARKGSLTAEAPQLAMQWHPDLNGALSPNEVDPDDPRAVWWSCSADPPHRWRCTVRARASADSGCPNCVRTHRQLLKELPSDLAREWHPERNARVQLEEIDTESAERVWWRCAKNPAHVWRASVRTRLNAPGCPTCRRLASLLGPSLAGRFPALARQWHPTKNGALRPEQHAPGSVRRVWWQCLVNPAHEWEAKIYVRTRYATGCPFCDSVDVTPATSLAAQYPQLVKEWNDRRNGALIPHDVGPDSGRTVWWQCAVHSWHVWQARVCDRVQGHGCPKCAGGGASRVTALSLRFPDVAKEWHPTKNGVMDPGMIRPTSTLRVWWQCSKNRSHRWQASPRQRTKLGLGCPVCGGGNGARRAS